MELALVSKEGKKSGKMKVSDAVFSAPRNDHVVHSVLVWYLASKRRGTHSAKTMGEVSGGGKKPWKQKGTGRARSGSSRSPLWAGGGVIFPPKPRKYGFSLPKKVRKLALKVVLSDKAKHDKIRLVEELAVSKPKTKEMSAFLNGIGIKGKTMIIAPKENKDVWLAARNIDGVVLSTAEEINIHDLLSSEWIVADKGSISKLEEVLK